MYYTRNQHMVRVPRQVIEYKLNDMPVTKPIQEKKRGQSGECNKAINNEVDKLLNASIVRESLFPSWIANPVLMKKYGGQWRMCVENIVTHFQQFMKT